MAAVRLLSVSGAGRVSGGARELTFTRRAPARAQGGSLMLRTSPFRLRPALLLPLLLAAPACSLPDDGISASASAAASAPTAELPAPPSDRPPGVAPGPLPGDQHFDFEALLKKGQMIRPIAAMRQQELLAARYDLADRPSRPGDDPRQAGPGGRAGQAARRRHLEATSPRSPPRRSRPATCSPPGFLPLPHPNHTEGGMVFPKSHIDEIEAPDRARPRALRPRLRPARPLPARSSRRPSS